MANIALRLVRFPVNQAFGFTYGGRIETSALTRLYPPSAGPGGAPLLFAHQSDAVKVANECGLDVHPITGFVSTLAGSEWER